MNKKGQWVRQMARDAKSAERRERIELTRDFLLNGLNSIEIANQLGISENTVKQYIREINFDVEFRKKLVEINKKITSLEEENNEEISDEVKKLENLIDNTKEIIKLYVQKNKLCEENGCGRNINPADMVKMVRILYGSLYSSTLSSLSYTFNDEQNSSKIPDNELEIFQKMYDKWEPYVKEEKVFKEQYEIFEKEVKDLDTEEGIENLYSILSKIKKAINFDKNEKKLDTITEDLISEYGISKDEVYEGQKPFNKASLLSITILFLNIIYPGVGTLVSGKREYITSGAFQLLLATITVIGGWAGPFIIAWIWALVSSIVIIDKSTKS